MQERFVFQFTPLDGDGALPQISGALEKQTELVSRQKNPKLWAMTDRLNQKNQGVHAARQKMRRLMGMFIWILGVILLLPGLMDPNDVPVVLAVGVIGVGIGTSMLWRAQRTWLGIVSLVLGVLLVLGSLSSPDDMGRFLPIGIAILVIGVASWLTRNHQKISPFDRAAQQLLHIRNTAQQLDGVQFTISAQEMALENVKGQDGRYTIPMEQLEYAFETDDLMLLLYNGSVTVLKKIDLIQGALPALRKLLDDKTTYVNIAQTA